MAVTVKILVASGLAALLLVLVYAPAFLLAGGLKLRMNAAVPVIIGMTFVAACALAAGYARWWRLRLADFGVGGASPRYFVLALLIAVPLSAAAQWAIEKAHESAAMPGLHLSRAALVLYFLLCAPIQEESIFRGLLQTVFARQLGRTAGAAIAGSIAAALLFALVHLEIGPVTAAGALLLGLLAGELRRRSCSLLPAILSHVIFNLPGFFTA
jgi:membrane protease YdiL (CAAX protease family)